MTTAPARAQSFGEARPGSLSRADLLAMGRASPGWAFLPLAIRTLRAHPEDAELRFLAAASLTRLGLRTCAAEQIELLPPQARAHPGVASLNAIVKGMPDDRLDLAQLERVLMSNLTALAQRAGEPVDLRPQLDAWRKQAADWDWFRATDGNIIRRRRDDPDAWRGLMDIRGQVAHLTLPHTVAENRGRSPSGGMGAIRPYIVEGMDPPWFAQRVLNETPAGTDGYHARVTLVQADVLEFMDGLAQTDLSALLAEPRVRVLVGPDAGARLLADLSSPTRQDTQIIGPGLSMSTVRTALSPSVESCLHQAGSAQVHEQRQLADRVLTLYAQRDRAWWARRFAESATTSGRPLRVLVPTCRYSTFIQHSASDLVEGFAAAGCEARVLIEPDAHSHFSANAYLRAMAEFEPDLVVLINFPRSSLGLLRTVPAPGQPAEGVLPEGVPFVAWIQDAMAHQMDEKVGRAMGDLDFVAGNVREEYYLRFGYPRSRGLHAPIVASSRKFNKGPVPEDLRRAHTCEVAYASHHGETPEQMHARKMSEAASTPGLVRILEHIRPGLDALAAAREARSYTVQIRELVLEAMRACGADCTNDTIVSQVSHLYALPMADRLMRHQTLAWTAEIAERRGWRFHIYGRGWNTSPMLSRYARGELSHGEELRASYACASAHLQISAHTAIHQRVIECALSGGLPVMRAQEDDLSSLEFSAALHAADRAIRDGRECDACDAFTLIRGQWRRLGYAVADCPEAMKVAALRERLGLPADSFVWLNSVHAQKLAAGTPLSAIDVPDERSLFWLLGDPAETMFASAEHLERILERAVNDADWRQGRVEALNDRIRDRLTDEAFALRLRAFVASALQSAP